MSMLRSLACAALLLSLSFHPALAQESWPKATRHKVATALSEQDAAALAGKTLAVTRHERASFMAQTAGKAQFGLLGIATAISSGKKIVEENGIDDPTALMRDILTTSLRDGYGMTARPVDADVTKEKKPAGLAKLHPEADYVLSVIHTGTLQSYFPTSWGRYWLMNSFTVQLVETGTGRSVVRANCVAMTNKHPVRPSRNQLYANRAQLLKEVLGSLTWACGRDLAMEAFKLSAEKAPAIPTEARDPLAGLPDDPSSDGDAKPDGQPPPATEPADPADAASATDTDDAEPAATTPVPATPSAR